MSSVTDIREKTTASALVDRNWRDVGLRLAYGSAATVSVLAWTFAIRAPLFLDETFSYWQIKAGFGQILSRRGSVSPVYPYLLWLATKVSGTSEAGLRAPSFLAMLAAAYLLYLAAKRFFTSDVAAIVVMLFCVHPLVVFAANDARPYAFGLLVTNAAILLLTQLREKATTGTAIALGALAGLIPSFQLVFCVIFPAFTVCLLVFQVKERRIVLRHLVIALCAFALTFLPNLPDLLKVFQERQTVVFDPTKPTLMDLFWTLSPWWWIWVIGAGVAVSAWIRRFRFGGLANFTNSIACASLGLIPLLLLYCLTVNTETNVFVERYRLVAIPGIALCWGLVVDACDSRWLRAVVCLLVVCTSTYLYWKSPLSSRHGYTWKYALELTEQETASDHASVVVCSDFPNSDFTRMPASEQVKDSTLFTPLSYYKLSSQVYGMPRSFNAESIRVGEAFVHRAAVEKRRFLALAAQPSFDSMLWLTKEAQASHSVRTLSDSGGMVVLEFNPRPEATN